MRIYQSCSSDHTLYHHYHTSCHHHGLTPGGGRSCIRHREKHRGRQGEVAASQGMDQSVLSAFHHGPICLELLTITCFRFEGVCPLQVKHHSVFTFFTPRRCTPVPFDIWYSTCSSSESSSTGNSEHWRKKTNWKEWNTNLFFLGNLSTIKMIFIKQNGNLKTITWHTPPENISQLGRLGHGWGQRSEGWYVTLTSPLYPHVLKRGNSKSSK